jgi:hypothetical protein
LVWHKNWLKMIKVEKDNLYISTQQAVQLRLASSLRFMPAC